MYFSVEALNPATIRVFSSVESCIESLKTVELISEYNLAQAKVPSEPIFAILRVILRGSEPNWNVTYSAPLESWMELAIK